jgi:hypothetical protein
MGSRSWCHSKIPWPAGPAAMPVNAEPQSADLGELNVILGIRFEVIDKIENGRHTDVRKLLNLLAPQVRLELTTLRLTEELLSFYGRYRMPSSVSA